MPEPVNDPVQDQPNPQLTQPELLESIPPALGQPEPGAKAARAPAATFIFFTVMLDMLAMGMIAPVLPRLIESFLHGDASAAAKSIGLFGTVFAAMQFVFSPIVGSLSDRYGRRPIVLLSNFGLGMDYVLMAWAPALSWLFLGRIISGLTASSIPTAMAYMADVTPHEKRAAAFGMLSAAFGAGFVLGPALGGVLGDISPRLPFVAAAGLSLLNGMYGLFVLPESLSKDHSAPFSWKRANPVGSLAMLAKSRSLLLLAGVLLLGYLAQQSLMNVYALYAEYRFHWSARTIGLSLGVVGIFQILYGAFLVRWASPKFGERRCIVFGLIFGAAGYASFAFTSTGLMLWLGIPFLNLMSLTWPNAQSLMSRNTSKSEQGQLQGAINGLRGASGIFGPQIFTWIFALAIGARALFHAPGAPFYTAAAMLLAAIPLGLLATRKSPPAPA